MKEKKHHSLVPLNRKTKFYTSSSIISDYQKKLMRKTETKNLRFRRLFFGKFNLYPCKYIVISIYIFGKMKTVLGESFIVSKVVTM